jgi:Polysaccharide deacetylase
MRIVVLSVAALAVSLGAMSSPQSPAPARPWPGQHQAALALTYDDALRSQLEVAIPQLDAAGLKGTFFLEGRNIGPDVPRWRSVGAHGHELANHTVNHPCGKGTYDMPPQYTSEAYSVEVLITEIKVMNGFLQAMDGKAAHSFATPCGQNLAGGQDYLGPMQQEHVATFIRDERTMPKSVMATGFVNASGADMIRWIEDVQRAGAAGVIVFHGVGGDYLNVSGEAHRQLVTYLKAHQREIWTTTFTELMNAVTRAGASPPASSK